MKISAAVYDKDERALQETGLMIQPEGTGIYIKDANGKLALIGVGVEETDAEGNKRTIIKLTADNIKLEGLVTANGYFKVKKDGSIECKGAKISGEVNATSGTFSGEVNATSGRFIGAIGAPYKIMSASSTLWPGVNTGMNIMISSADRATVGVVLPIYTEIDGVECDIINVCDTYTIITLPINVDIRDDTQPHIFYRNQKLTHVQLEGGCCRLRMKAFIKPGTEYCSWTILNTTDFQKVKSGTGVSYFVKSIIE